MNFGKAWTIGAGHLHHENDLSSNKRTFDMFSTKDFIGFIKNIRNRLHAGHGTEQNYFIVVNTFGVYSLKVGDSDKMSSFISNYYNKEFRTEWIDKLNKEIRKKIRKESNNDDFWISETENLEFFLKLLQDLDIGLELYKADEHNLTQWNKLELDNNQIKTTPCTN